LLDQIVLLHLRGDDLVQRSILVEEQVRVTISQDPRTFRGKHEELVTSIWYAESSALVLAPILGVTESIHLFLPSFIKFLGDILVAFRAELVGGVIPYRGQCFY